MRGPPPKPTETRQRRNARPELQVVEASSSDVDIFIPDPPTGLLESTQAVWASYWSSKVSRAVDLSSDAHLLDRWIRAVDEYERVSKTFRRKRVVKGSMGQPVLNPLGSYLAQLKGEIAKAEAELGLTPLSRLRLGIAFGTARMTADDLNRELEQPSESAPADVIDAEPGDDWQAEWEDA